MNLCTWKQSNEINVPRTTLWFIHFRCVAEKSALFISYTILCLSRAIVFRLSPAFSLSFFHFHTHQTVECVTIGWMNMMPVTNRYELTPATWHKIICNIQLYANFARCVSTSIHATPTYLSYWYANIEHTLKLFLFSLSLRWLLNILKHFFNCIFTSMLFHSITSITRTI